MRIVFGAGMVAFDKLARYVTIQHIYVGHIVCSGTAQLMTQSAANRYLSS
jgi:hypothetical protein